MAGSPCSAVAPLSAGTDPPRRGRKPGVSKGYSQLPSGSFRIRVAGFPGETVPDELTAAARVAEMRLAKRDGYGISPSPRGRSQTLAEASVAFFEHKRAAGGRHGSLTPAGLTHWEMATRPWREGPLSPKPLRVLTRDELQSTIDVRTMSRRVAARYEAQALLAILKYARDGGIDFSPTLLTIEVPRKTRRTKAELTPEELDFLVARAAPRGQPLLQLAAMLGARVGELFALERTWVDIDAREIRFPLEATKEKREKRIDLTHEEVELLRAQLIGVYTRFGTTSKFVFPKSNGARWRYNHFHARVWTPAKEKAAREWRETRALGADETTPFDSITMHALRRSCVNWLRASDLPIEVIAQRLGHGDQGATLLRQYRRVSRAEVRAALDSLGYGVRARLRELEQQRQREADR